MRIIEDILPYQRERQFTLHVSEIELTIIKEALTWYDPVDAEGELFDDMLTALGMHE